MDSEQAKDWFKKLYEVAEHPEQVTATAPPKAEATPPTKEKHPESEPQLDYLRAWEMEEEKKLEHLASLHEVNQHHQDQESKKDLTPKDH